MMRLRAFGVRGLGRHAVPHQQAGERDAAQTARELCKKVPPFERNR
jgi:hypothetical protein